jgi:hypothetical protein
MKKYIGTKIVEAEPFKNAGAPGYKVVYEDGYKSWSPKAAFEAAYREVDGVPFGLALEHVKRGGRMRLPKWSPDVVILGQFPDEGRKMTAPYLYVDSRFGRVPWSPTMIELMADDWVCGCVGWGHAYLCRAGLRGANSGNLLRYSHKIAVLLCWEWLFCFVAHTH